jgi:protein required for attachment to host cells
MSAGATLVVVADGGVGRFLLRDRPRAPLLELTELRLSIAEISPRHNQAPRAHDGFAGGQYKIEHRLPLHEEMEEAFLRKVLRRAIDIYYAEKGACLVLCAPPRALGVLKRDLTTDLKKHLALSLGKDLTQETPATIDARLQELRV